MHFRQDKKPAPGFLYSPPFARGGWERLFIILLFIATAPAYAQSPPVPRSKTQALDAVQHTLHQEKRQQAALQQQMEGIKSELDDTRGMLVTLAEEVQQNEKSLGMLEKRIEALTGEEQTLTEKLEQDYSSIADLILAMERMRRVPPESLIVRPGAPLKTAQSAMLLQSILPAVDKRATQLSDDLKRLSDIAEALERDKAAALQKQAELSEKRKSLQSLIDKREKLYSSTQKDYASRKREVERLSREAKTLMDLLARLEDSKREDSVDAQRIAHVYGAGVPDAGAARLPVNGSIIEAFGKPNSIGAMSQGVTIESRPGSLVVAPMGGVIRFAGAFKNYGNMVIIEHKDGYHSLIAGLQTVQTGEESRVKPGEPIGQLPLTSSRGGSPALYYELRYKGQPVNPAERFSDLKS